MMDFGEVLSRAWQIVWKHKILWIFGILAGCGSAGGSGGNSGYRMNGRDVPPGVDRFFNNIEPWQVLLIALAVFVVVVLIAVIVALLASMGRAGLIRGTLRADNGSDHLTFGELWAEGRPYFLRLFLLNLAIALTFGVVGIVIAITLVGITAITFGLGLICILPLLCLLVPLMWFVDIVVEQANVALVVEDLGLVQSVQRAWQTVQAQLANMLILGLIVGIGGFVAMFLINLPLVIALGPVLLSLLIGEGQPQAWGIGLSIVCAVAYLPVLLALSGLIQAYIGSVWTLAYVRANRIRLNGGVPQVEPLPPTM
ncbi:MAG: hypothetical protein OHK0052_10180 [Anaerolineales bacterium]